jgi:hypothetical protein
MLRSGGTQRSGEEKRLDGGKNASGASHKEGGGTSPSVTPVFRLRKDERATGKGTRDEPPSIAARSDCPILGRE